MKINILLDVRFVTTASMSKVIGKDISSVHEGEKLLGDDRQSLETPQRQLLSQITDLYSIWNKQTV